MGKETQGGGEDRAEGAPVLFGRQETAFFCFGHKSWCVLVTHHRVHCCPWKHKRRTYRGAAPIPEYPRTPIHRSKHVVLHVWGQPCYVRAELRLCAQHQLVSPQVFQRTLQTQCEVRCLQQMEPLMRGSKRVGNAVHGEQY